MPAFCRLSYAGTSSHPALNKLWLLFWKITVCFSKWEHIYSPAFYKKSADPVLFHDAHTMPPLPFLPVLPLTEAVKTMCFLVPSI